MVRFNLSTISDRSNPRFQLKIMDFRTQFLCIAPQCTFFLYETNPNLYYNGDSNVRCIFEFAFLIADQDKFWDIQIAP